MRRAAVAMAALRRPQVRAVATSSSGAAVMTEALRAKEARLDELRKAHAECHAVAERHPDRTMRGIMGFLLLQAVVLMDWTYVHFDWNLVEPITYLIGYSATWIGLAWYGSMQQEFGYGSLREMLQARKMNALMAQRGINAAEIATLESDVARLRRLVRSSAGTLTQ